MRGRAVTVERRVRVGDDPFGGPLWREERERVEGCLVSPGATAPIGEDRPEGASVAFTVAWPKVYTAPLKGCTVEIDGVEGRFAVSGDPRPVPDNCPTRWNRVSEVSHVEG